MGRVELRLAVQELLARTDACELAGEGPPTHVAAALSRESPIETRGPETAVTICQSVYSRRTRREQAALETHIIMRSLAARSSADNTESR